MHDTSAVGPGVTFARAIQGCIDAEIVDCAAFGKRSAVINVSGSGAPLAVRNTTLVTDADMGSMVFLAGMGATFNHCVIDAAGGQLSVGNGVPYAGDYNVFTRWRHPDGSAAGAMNGWFGNASRLTLAAWQAATGQDVHSVTLKASDQVSGGANAFYLGTALATGGPEVGDFRINPNARVYGGDLTEYIGTFPDGTPITDAGPQTHWDWDERAIAAGPPTRTPVFPPTLAEMRSYITAPEAWIFYP
jgi:hypothetical protein